jgi:hypothetical protein
MDSQSGNDASNPQPPAKRGLLLRILYRVYTNYLGVTPPTPAQERTADRRCPSRSGNGSLRSFLSLEKHGAAGRRTLTGLFLSLCLCPRFALLLGHRPVGLH